MGDTGVILSEKSSVSFLPEDGSRKGSKRRFMAVDIKVKESNVALIFIVLGERDGG